MINVHWAADYLSIADMARLAALIPPPRAHLVPFAGMRSGLLEGQLRYFGVLAPNAKLREQVVQTAGPSPAKGAGQDWVRRY